MRRAAFLLLILSGSARAFEEAGSAERNLAKMIRALETGSWTERIHAVHELEYMHDEAIPGLALAMEDGDWQVRLTAVQALSPRSAEGITAMKKLLKHETCPVVRLMTMHALGSQGPSADEQRKVMSWMSSASTKEVNTCQDQAGPGKAPWARGAAPAAAASSVSSPAAARAVPSAPSAAKPSAPSAPAEPEPEGEELVTPDPIVKAPAAAEPKTRRAPEEMPEPTKFQRRIELDAWLDAPPAGPGRAKAPASEVAARSTAAPESLGRPFALPGRASPEAPAGRYEADAGTGAERRDPVPELLRALKRADPRARARAADELGRFGGASEPAVTALVAALRDKSPRVRSSAGLALGNIGASRAGVVPLLIKALKDGSEDVRFAAALALSRIGTDEAREAFRSHVGDEARAAIDRPKVKSR